MTLRYAVNCSILFGELPVNDRPAAAAAAGFTAVEFWWPWTVAVPTAAEVDAFVGAIEAAGVDLIGLNLFAGDMPGGERGLVSNPARVAEFRENLPVVVDIATRTGCRAFNALYGNRLDGISAEEQDALALENLVLAAEAVAPLGGTILVEPISGSPGYPLKTADETVAVVDRARAAGASNVTFLYDAYHLAANGDDVLAALDRHYDVIGHVQIADNPGRNEPGTGEMDIDAVLAGLTQRGWPGYVALEYKPSAGSDNAFDWLPRELRGARS